MDNGEDDLAKRLFGTKLPVTTNVLPDLPQSETKEKSDNTYEVKDVDNSAKWKKEEVKKLEEAGRFENLQKTLKKAGAMNSEVHQQIKKLAMASSPDSVFLGQPAIIVTMAGNPDSPAANDISPEASSLARNCQPSPGQSSSSEVPVPFVGNMHLNAYGLLVSDKQPYLLEGTVLRDYQLKGLDWLQALDVNVVNGILGDEMGLGKTVQVIAMICFLIERGVPGPFIILAPLAVIPNWIDQFAEFAPQVPTLKYHGSPIVRKSLFQQLCCKKLVADKYNIHPVVVTSHGMPLIDSCLRLLNWRYLVVDEGHRLKNHKTSLHKTLGSWVSQSRLILTGTPLQNHLRELWSLLNFLLPDVFEDLSTFETWFDPKELAESNSIKTSVDKERETLVINLLRGALEPFLMRRVKSQVNLTLPTKSEVILCCPMTSEQVKLYEEALVPNDSPRKEDMPFDGRKVKRRCVVQRLVFGKTYEEESSSPRSSQASPKEISSLSGSTRVSQACQPETELNIVNGLDVIKEDENIYQKRKLSCSNKMMLLRNITNHPHLATHEDNIFSLEMIRMSSKMALLEKMLPILKSKKHKVLLFSFFKTVLDLIEVLLVDRGYGFCRMDGSYCLEDRISEMKMFNTAENNKFVFLLTTRTGGLGLNLTAADTVIFFDADWNPHVDLQAEDRCHRIGQTRPVTVYRLVSKNSIDTLMLERAKGKKKLEKLFLAGNASFSNKLISSGDKVGLKQIEDILSFQETNFSFPDNGEMFSEAELKVLLR